MKQTQRIRIGISQGDINGISYEVIIKTLLDNRILELATPIVYGSSKVSAYHRKALSINNFNLINIRTPQEANPKRANIINVLDDNVRVELGKSTEEAGEASLLALNAAVNDLKNGEIDALVTAPINKKNIQSKAFQFPGHTEYLEENFSSRSLMLMVSENLKIGVVSGHLPIAEVPAFITKERILEKLHIINHSLKRDFAKTNARIAVFGLNPHAGDNGLIGKEEQETIIPAIEQAQKEGIMALGPYPADGFFATDSYKDFDAVLAMYHDQGLTPFKALAFDSGVNYTAGLPIVRTSPAHGTAYDIAGNDKANPDSFRNALYLACDIFKNRELFDQANENPLTKAQVD